jgi:hypothetical protein
MLYKRDRKVKANIEGIVKSDNGRIDKKKKTSGTNEGKGGADNVKKNPNPIINAKRGEYKSNPRTNTN